jgi:hypothetical protein
MYFNTMFVVTYFLKFCYNVFILENKIDARVFRRTCVNLYYITLEIVLICVDLERVPSNVSITHMPISKHELV